MTQHLLEQHTEEDHHIMRQLALVVGGFFVATVAMAIIIGAVMG